MVFKNICIPVLRAKVALAFEGLRRLCQVYWLLPVLRMAIVGIWPTKALHCRFLPADLLEIYLWPYLTCKILFLLMLLFFDSDLNLPLCWWWLILPIRNKAKTLKNDWNPGMWVLIGEFSVRAIKWIPTWQGYQKALHPCAIDQSNLSIGRVMLHE